MNQNPKVITSYSRSYNCQSTTQTKALTSSLQHGLRNWSTIVTMENNKLSSQVLDLGLSSLFYKVLQVKRWHRIPFP